MTNNTNITGRQVLNDCITLVKHLGEYVICLTVRIAGNVKSMLAERGKQQDGDAADKANSARTAHGKTST